MDYLECMRRPFGLPWTKDASVNDPLPAGADNLSETKYRRSISLKHGDDLGTPGLEFTSVTQQNLSQCSVMCTVALVV